MGGREGEGEGGSPKLVGLDHVDVVLTEYKTKKLTFQAVYQPICTLYGYKYLYRYQYVRVQVFV